MPSQGPPMQANRVSQPLRKKKRYADKLISPQVRELVPESQAYMDLLAFEQKLDATITRKKLDIQEALKRPQKVKKRLRIYISHTFIAGKEPEKEGDEGTVPMWELRVEGRLIEDQTNGTAASGHSTPAPPARPLPKRKFSSFFKSL
ncbi:SWI/SNF matrix-associated actin-dependent regulator of chromatin subfamily D member 1, partial [Trichostrongylus colubriformis]